jgi:uncharacterized protein YggE
MGLFHRTVFVLALQLTGVGLAQAQSQTQDRSSWVVTVSGEGTAAVVPDLAEVRAGVVTQGKTAREASEANSRATAALLLVVKAGGIADTDVQTSRFAIQPVQEPSRNAPARIIGFQASSQLTIRVRDVATVGDVVDRLVGAGANEFSGISLHVSAPSKALDGAREEAIADARRKAEIYARAAGLGLGRTVTIVEEGASGAPVTFRAVASQAGTPIAAGQETLRVGVTVTFELLR